MGTLITILSITIIIANISLLVIVKKLNKKVLILNLQQQDLTIQNKVLAEFSETKLAEIRDLSARNAELTRLVAKLLTASQKRGDYE